jgi:ADP-ribose pyrophosphatase YjhB (NUDIX family)
MHHIQVKILDKLNHVEVMRFSELRIESVDSNLFTYHLKQLIRDGFVEKLANGYTLTAQGIFHVDRYSSRLSAIRMQPKIMTMIDLINEHGESVVVRRKYQPFIGRVSFPSGKLHLEETVLESARRELLEKTSIVYSELNQAAVVYLIVRKQGQLVGHYLIHLFSARVGHSLLDGTILQPMNERWAAPYWQDISGLHETEVMPGLHDLHQLNLNSSKSLQFCELAYELT